MTVQSPTPTERALIGQVWHRHSRQVHCPGSGADNRGELTQRKAATSCWAVHTDAGDHSMNLNATSLKSTLQCAHAVFAAHNGTASFSTIFRLDGPFASASPRVAPERCPVSFKGLPKETLRRHRSEDRIEVILCRRLELNNASWPRSCSPTWWATARWRNATSNSRSNCSKNTAACYAASFPASTVSRSKRSAMLFWSSLPG